jgi:hypothetical protein
MPQTYYLPHLRNKHSIFDHNFGTRNAPVGAAHPLFGHDAMQIARELAPQQVPPILSHRGMNLSSQPMKQYALLFLVVD